MKRKAKRRGWRLTESGAARVQLVTDAATADRLAELARHEGLTVSGMAAVLIRHGLLTWQRSPERADRTRYQRDVTA